MANNPEYPALNIPGPDREPSEMGGDDGWLQLKSKGARHSAEEAAMLMRRVDPMDVTGAEVDPGTAG